MKTHQPKNKSGHISVGRYSQLNVYTGVWAWRKAHVAHTHTKNFSGKKRDCFQDESLKHTYTKYADSKIKKKNMINTCGV